MAKASENLTPVTLELGGKGANIVFQDGTFATLQRQFALEYSQMQDRCWPLRLLVHEDVRRIG